MMHIRKSAKWLLWAVIVVAFGLPETLRATIVIVNLSREKVSVVADSRVGFGDGTYDDDYCKVTVLADGLVFAATGISGQSKDRDYDSPARGNWSARQEARRALEQYKKVNDPASQTGKLNAMATMWGNAMQRRLQAAMRVNGNILQRRTNGGRLTQGIFAGMEQGQAAVVTVDLVYDPPEVKVVTRSLRNGVSTFGMTEVAREFLINPETERARMEKQLWDEQLETWPPEERQVQTAIHHAKLTLTHESRGETIGGQIDALELSAAGLRWVQKKFDCPAD